MNPLTLVFFLLCLSLPSPLFADTPAHCLFEQYLGYWTYSLGPNSNTNSVNCSLPFRTQTRLRLLLKAPNVVIDSNGNLGNFTLIYDEGVEIHLKGVKYFAFSRWTRVGTKVVSYCNETLPGWFHNFDETHWGCFVATQDKNLVSAINEEPEKRPPGDQLYQQETLLVEEINRSKGTWKATTYPQFSGKTISFMRNLAGGISIKKDPSNPKSKGQPNLKLNFNDGAKTGNTGKRSSLGLPTSFDWRNVNGVNYVSPVRNQGGCGSCYTFASTGMLEARIRILSENTKTPILSPQSVVSCSEYSQGCDGGFNYLVSKYGEDFGILEEQCFPYVGINSPCSQKVCNATWTATNYYYVGGYFGACTEDLMMRELYDNGPIAISFDVHSDFMNYRSGIYVHNTTLTAKFSVNPWEETNHAVLLVGWGVENQVPYWIVKNSWGEQWGESGFFRILRGVDECAIESMGVAATPILH